MLVGVSMFPTDFSIRPDELARLVESYGFESLWFPEHTHIPASRLSPWPGGGELPREYWHGYDPFIALTAAAMVTSRIRLGTGVCLVVQHDPIVLAKVVASLDRLSGGRFLFGIGAGWNREEMANHGTRFESRWRLLRERVLAMKAIWTQEEASFHGQFVNFDRIWCHPKPLQQPHPPVLMGGDGPRTFDRVLEFGDGWIPLGGRRSEGPTLAEKVAELRRRAQAAGRDPESLSVTVYGSRPEREAVQRLEEAGAQRVVIGLPSAGRDSIEPALQRIARELL